jgi:hypothetical protein
MLSVKDKASYHLRLPILSSPSHTRLSSGQHYVDFLRESDAVISSNFQAIFSTAARALEKLSKKDLRAHSLALQLQSCDCPTSILAVRQGQVDN